ncbi:hypothetical protein E4U21_004940 [Claviceps maximensis]|nr:hypothetical protein E4U21_004940 [Claviceps maximensis]
MPASASTVPVTAQHSRHDTFTSPFSTYTRPTHKKTMSVTQTYYLAHKARAKLSQEAARPDHDLRLLVGHANLLDTLMLDLVDAEREQERLYNQSVRGDDKTPSRRVQWADEVVEQTEEEYDESDSESDSEIEDEQDTAYTMDSTVSVRTSSSTISATSTTAPTSVFSTARSPQSPSRPHSSEVVVVVSEHDDILSDDEDDDFQEDYAQLELVRTPSHVSSPPDLLLDQDSESSDDDESMPPSPKDHALEYTHKEAKAQSVEEEIMESDYYITRQPSRGLVSAISVY